MEHHHIFIHIVSRGSGGNCMLGRSMATVVQAKLGVLFLLVAAAPAIAAAATDDDDYGGCYYAVHIRGAPAAAKNTSVLFTLLGYDGSIVWEWWGRAGSYMTYRHFPQFRHSRRFRKSPPNFIVYRHKFCEDPCHLKLKVEDPGLDHLLPLSVRIKAIDDEEDEDDEDDEFDYDNPRFARVFTPVLPTNPLVPGEADMDICAAADDDECSYVVSVQAPPAAVNTAVQFTVSNKAGQLLWWDFVYVKKVSFEFTSETDSKCQDPCHLKIKVKDHSAGLLPLSVSIRAIETDIQEQDFARSFTPVVPKIDPTKKPALVLDQADMDLCNIIQTK